MKVFTDKNKEETPTQCLSTKYGTLISHLCEQKLQHCTSIFLNNLFNEE